MATCWVTLGTWDVVLIIAVSLQATALAYLGHPRWKAFLLSLPVPFTVASLSLNTRVDVTNVAGLPLLMAYTCGVYALHRRLRVPIILSIVVCAAGYCAVASLLAPRLPTTEAAFWGLSVAVLAMGAVLLRLMPAREEPAHRSPLPVYVKLPLIAAVILGLVIIKHQLRGFMTLFPMVGVVASYEGRHCLWTLCRQIPVVMLTMLPMMVAMRIIYPLGGMAWAVIGGWVVLLALLIPLSLREAAAARRTPSPSGG